MSGLIFLAKPSAICIAMHAEAQRSGAVDFLGRTMFPLQNWHQSLSDRQPDQPHLREAMLRAGANVQARVVTMTLNRIVSSVGQAGHVQWSFKAFGTPENFDELKAAIRTALAQQGIHDDTNNSPHITLSYFAPGKRPSMKIAPITWSIDELLLVNAGGDPYRYDVLGSWPLIPDSTAKVSQLGLL